MPSVNHGIFGKSENLNIEFEDSARIVNFVFQRQDYPAMIKPLILLIAAAGLVALIAPNAKAQLTATKAFTSAPQRVFPLLDTNTRLDMVDYYNSNLATPSANKLQGRSRITDLTDKTLTVEMSPSSTHEIIILPSARDSIIGLITTLATPAPDSHLSLYDRNWKELDTSKYFVKPTLEDWLTTDGKKNRAEVETMIPFLLISYNWDPATLVLTLNNNTNQFLSSDIYSIVAPYMLSSITYAWEGDKFNKQK